MKATGERNTASGAHSEATSLRSPAATMRCHACSVRSAFGWSGMTLSFADDGIAQPADAGAAADRLPPRWRIAPRGLSPTSVQPPASSGSLRNSLNPNVPSGRLMIFTHRWRPRCARSLRHSRPSNLWSLREPWPHADSASGVSISVDSAPPITVSLRPAAAVAMFSAKKRAMAIGWRVAVAPLRAAASAPRAR